MGVAANMIVRLGMDLTGFSSGAKKATNEFSSAVKKMSSSVGKIPKLNTKNLYQLSEEPQKELDALNNAIERQQKLIKGLTAQLGNIAPEGFDALTKSSKEDVAYLEKQIQKSKELRSELLNKRYGDSGYEDAAEKVKELTSYIASMEKKLQQTFNSTKIASGLSEAAKQVNAQLDMMQNRKIFLQAQVDTSGVESVLQDMVNPSERDDALDEFENRINQLRAEMDGASVGKKFSLAFRQVALEAEDAIKHIPKLAASAAGASLKAFEKIPSVLSKITHPIQTLTSKFPQMSKAAKDAGGGVGNAFKTMLKYTVGIRSLYILVNQLRSALVTGFGNLTKESNQTNYTLSTLKSSLTMLQNSFAAAFSPLVNTVAPILASFIQTIADAISYVGAFFATLTGQGSYTRAVYNYQSIADSAGSAASGTDAANKAAEEYQKTLAGFDEITKLNEQNNGNGGSGGGSGGGGGAGSGVSFETVSIPNVVSDWAEKFMEAWEKADFTEFGTIVGTKLKNALDSIDWTGIQEKCEKVAKSVATFLNGFFETEDLGTSIGETLGQAFNTALITMDTFFTQFHWDSLGTFIADSINGLFSGIDWSFAAKTLSDGVKGAFGTITTALQNIQWYQIGEDIRTFLTDVDWAGIAQSAFTALGSAFGGLASFISGLIGNALDNFYAKYIEPYISQIEAAGGDIVDGIFMGIGSAIADAGKWIANNIFMPFIDGFKEAFGIHSPASAPELLEAAGYVGEGILNGILQPFKNISSWVKENILTPISNAIKKAPESAIEFTAKIKTSLSDLVKGFTGKTIEFAAKIGTSVSSLVSKFTGRTISFLGKISTSASDIVSKFTGRTISFAGKISTSFSALVSKFTGKTIRFAARIVTTFTQLVRNFTGRVISFGAKLLGRATGGMYRNGHWSPVQSYATGGLPNQGQMFIAREAGPELVGSIGSGTAVMNNDQIVASVSAGVYKAVLAAMSGSRGSGNQNITVQVILDSKVAGEAFVNYLKGQAAQGNYPLTGLV